MRRSITITLIFAPLACIVGCSSGRLPTPEDLAYDSARARGVLVAVLDAWKQGRAAELGRQRPPIRFADDDFATGSRLVSYEIGEQSFPLAPFKNIHVHLMLRDRRGKVHERRATYQVVLNPTPAVLRSDT